MGPLKVEYTDNFVISKITPSKNCSEPSPLPAPAILISILKDILKKPVAPEVFNHIDLTKFAPFTQSVYKELLKTTPGTTITYKELATICGSPNAARAVGNAMANNPIPILIPCHRVVSTTDLGGYAFGLQMKQKLLDYEKAL